MPLILTPAERKVLTMKVEGMLGKQIADKLGVTAKTIEKQFSNAKKRNKVNSNRIVALHAVELYKEMT
jgi:DNA-binding NarL/FixJ family response regulator